MENNNSCRKWHRGLQTLIHLLFSPIRLHWKERRNKQESAQRVEVMLPTLFLRTKEGLFNILIDFCSWILFCAKQGEALRIQEMKEAQMCPTRHSNSTCRRTKIKCSDFPGGLVVKNLPTNAGTQVQSLVQEAPICLGVIKTVSHNSGSPRTLEHLLCNERSHHNEKPMYRRE